MRGLMSCFDRIVVFIPLCLLCVCCDYQPIVNSEKGEDNKDLVSEIQCWEPVSNYISYCDVEDTMLFESIDDSIGITLIRIEGPLAEELESETVLSNFPDFKLDNLVNVDSLLDQKKRSEMLLKIKTDYFVDLRTDILKIVTIFLQKRISQVESFKLQKEINEKKYFESSRLLKYSDPFDYDHSKDSLSLIEIQLIENYRNIDSIEQIVTELGTLDGIKKVTYNDLLEEIRGHYLIFRVKKR